MPPRSFAIALLDGKDQPVPQRIIGRTLVVTAFVFRAAKVAAAVMVLHTLTAWRTRLFASALASLIRVTIGAPTDLSMVFTVSSTPLMVVLLSFCLYLSKVAPTTVLSCLRR